MLFPSCGPVVENDLHLINAHKNHHLPSFVAFVDLVKAYDTANHDLHLHILKKYGAPPKFVASMRTSTPTSLWF
jgi:hypothetical protein